MPPLTIDPLKDIVQGNDRLRALLSRWRASEENLAVLFPEAAGAVRADFRLKESVLYPAVLKADHSRAHLVDAAIRQHGLSLDWLASAEALGAGHDGFSEPASDVAAKTDAQLLHETRDFLPSLRENLSDADLRRLVSDYTAAQR